MINYDLTKIKAIIFDVDGVLSLNTITMDNDGIPVRTVNIKDGYAIQLAIKKGLDLAIMTGADTENIRRRYERLGMQNVYLKCSMKIAVYEDFISKKGYKDDEIIYVGDDIPDYEIMKRVGCPCCPSDAAPEIRDISVYISNYAGGAGCGRDIIEQVMRAKGLWVMDEKAFGW